MRRQTRISLISPRVDLSIQKKRKVLIGRFYLSAIFTVFTGFFRGNLRPSTARANPEELKYDLQIMLPAMNTYERAEMINAGRANTPPQVFQGVLKLAEQVLGSDDWAALKSKIGVT
jgi:hypothetical protein